MKVTKEMLLAAGFSASAHGGSTTGHEKWEAFLNNAPTPPSQARAALAATPAALERTCGVCGADEAFTGTCGGGRVNPTALCFEGAVATAIPAAAAPVVLPEPDAEIAVLMNRSACQKYPNDINLRIAHNEGWNAARALLATATGLPAQAVAYIDSEVLTSFSSSSNYRPADGWDCHIRHQENKRDTDIPLYSRPQAQADARDAEITWPKARDIGRIGDMSQVAHIRVGFDSDNDVFVSVWDENGGGSIEFCNPGGGGGGQSSRTRMALIALMVAMEADNVEKPSRDWWAQRAAIATAKGEQQS
ncbi:hypothetical protein [Comamonas thiooxydans]|uniref:hypothetical protein n=1 Tax=Comamonas thiooxydans TaxID=363952 RepID=UPI00103FFD9F|nr:hypothetical protein [Comamonas thiooxydans]